MELSNEFWLQISVYLVSMGTFGGVVLTRLSNLEKKQDKHNNLIERMAVAENNIRALKEHEKEGGSNFKKNA